MIIIRRSIDRSDFYFAFNKYYIGIHREDTYLWPMKKDDFLNLYGEFSLFRIV
jgi:hypothetical protein